MKRTLAAAIALLAVAGLAFGAEKTAEAKKGWLGVQVTDLSEPMQVALGVKEGVLVVDVVGDSPAEKAGFAKGDIILKIDDQNVEETYDLTRYTRKNPGKTVTLAIIRTGAKKSLTAQLADKPMGDAEQLILKYNKDGKVWACTPGLLESMPDIGEAYGDALKLYGKELESSKLTDAQLKELKKALEQVRKALDDIEKRLKAKGI